MGDYVPVEAAYAVPKLLDSFRAHALLIWVGLPLYAAAQNFVPVLRPNCVVGYSTIALVGVALVALYHLHQERQAWATCKSLLAPGECVVMGNLGIFRRRKRMVLLGIIEDLDLYTDLMFPWIARACDIDGSLTRAWMTTWQAVPVIGPGLARAAQKLGFWGAALIAMCLMVLMGLKGLIDILRAPKMPVRTQELVRSGSNLSERESEDTKLLSGEDFYMLARFADNAVMPSVASLCEEMGAQKRYVYKPGDAAARTKFREEVALGKKDQSHLDALEHVNQSALERVESAGKVHFAFTLLGKVLIGNTIQMWLQASFFQLAFASAGKLAMYKLLFGMFLSFVVVCVRCIGVLSKAPGIGGASTLLNAFLVVWAGAKVYYAFKCESHLWGITTGCIPPAISLLI